MCPSPALASSVTTTGAGTGGDESRFELEPPGNLLALALDEQADEVADQADREETERDSEHSGEAAEAGNDHAQRQHRHAQKQQTRPSLAGLTRGCRARHPAAPHCRGPPLQRVVEITTRG